MLIYQICLIYGSYHSKATKHDCNKPAGARSANEIKVFAGERYGVFLGCLPFVYHDPLNLTHKFFDDEKGREASYTASVQRKNARNMRQWL